MTNDQIIQNNSGQGPNSSVPESIKNHFNWGVLLLTWLWGIGNKTYITFIVIALCLIPVVGPFISLGVQIWFGFKGNEWAWQNKKWESVEHFHRVQKNWAIAGLALILIGIALSILTAILTTVAAFAGAQI